MSSTFESTNRFLRPADVARLRRNQRQIQVYRLFIVVANVLLVAAVIIAGGWIFRWVRSDARFSVKSVEVIGADHTSKASLDAVTRSYVGLNLFKIDIARVRRDLGGLPWIRQVAIEQKLPDTLTIRVLERRPLAIVMSGGSLRYADETGTAFAQVTPGVGDDDLPIITDAQGDDLVQCTRLLTSLRTANPGLYSRISEVRPAPPKGFAIYDRAVGAFVYTEAAGIEQHWRDLDAILRAEHLQRGQIEYADLRFDGRVIVKPFKPIITTETPRPGAATQITN